MQNPRVLSPSTIALQKRRAELAEEGKAAMAEYRQAERDRLARTAELRRERLEKLPVGKADN
jgi:hypothetical protein